MPSEDQISKLLRLKRHEQPRPGYFEDFLAEFQQRQRTELLRRPLWEIIGDRFSALLPTIEVPRFAYGAIAALAVASTGLILLHPNAPLAASTTVASTVATLTLTSPQPVTIGASVPVALSSSGAPSVHYVLPTSPARYASSRSF